MSGWRCFGPATRQPPWRRLRPCGLPLGAFRPHRLDRIGDRRFLWRKHNRLTRRRDRWFLWRKHNGLALRFARRILRLWGPLAWLLRRLLRWDSLLSARQTRRL